MANGVPFFFTYKYMIAFGMFFLSSIRPFIMLFLRARYLYNYMS